MTLQPPMSRGDAIALYGASYAKVTRSDLRSMAGYRLVVDPRFGIFRRAKQWEVCIQTPTGEWLPARNHCRLKDAKASLSSESERRRLLKKVAPHLL